MHFAHVRTFEFQNVSNDDHDGDDDNDDNTKSGHRKISSGSSQQAYLVVDLHLRMWTLNDLLCTSPSWFCEYILSLT